jgi:prepilin-type N-terminal cleavage/methylation domain-containing protein
MRMRNTPARGFTLIEVAVSIFVIGIMIVASAALLHGVPVSRISHSQSIALAIAESKIEALRAGGYDSLPASGSFTDVALSSLASSTASTTVTVYDSKTKRVDVGVSWLETDSVRRYVSLATLITQIGGLK